MKKLYQTYIKSLKDGLNIIIYHFITFLVLISFYFLFKDHQPLFLILLFICSIFLILTINFFRNPSRDIKYKKNKIYAPADGTVSSVNIVKENKYLNKKTCRIKIFMDIFNVHRNRAPLGGDVTLVKYEKGKLKAAFKEVEDSNEQFIISLKTRSGTILLKLIAGLIARRIICSLNKGDKIKTGALFGMIKFGSAVIIYLPLSVNITIKKGDKIKAGLTEIGQF